MAYRWTTRREALTQALLLVGAGVTAATLAACERHDKADVAEGRYFTGKEMALVTQVSDVMIPHGAVPGALAAGVPSFVEGMMGTWAGRRAKAQIGRAIAEFDAVAQSRFGQDFGALPAVRRYDVVAAIDRKAFAGTRNPSAPGDYAVFKQLVFLGYTTSRAFNARYVAIPGSYSGDLSKMERDALVAERA